MKTAVYFTSPEFNLWEVEKAIAIVNTKKDKWVSENAILVQDVDGEEIFFNTYGSQNEKVFVTIKFNYYLVSK